MDLRDFNGAVDRRRNVTVLQATATRARRGFMWLREGSCKHRAMMWSLVLAPDWLRCDCHVHGGWLFSSFIAMFLLNFTSVINDQIFRNEKIYQFARVMVKIVMLTAWNLSFESMHLRTLRFTSSSSMSQIMKHTSKSVSIQIFI